MRGERLLAPLGVTYAAHVERVSSEPAPSGNLQVLTKHTYTDVNMVYMYICIYIYIYRLHSYFYLFVYE